jgi:pyruvate dehydrogenase (quinone)
VMIGSDYPYTEFLPEKATVVQIDERAFVIGRRLPVAQAIVGSSRPAVAALAARVQPKSDRGFLESMQREWASWRAMLDEKADPARSADRIHPQVLVRAVSDLAAADAAFSIDTGEVTLWSGNWLRPRVGQVVTGSFNNAAVGTALGIANGVQALDPARQVIVLCGDGGFAMLMQEFATSVQHALPVKVFVFDNGGWGLVRMEMAAAAMPAFSEGVDVRNPDFALFAQACGGVGLRVDKPQALRETVARALAEPGPVVVHVAVDRDEIPAMPHVDLAKAWKFGIGKARELLAR